MTTVYVLLQGVYYEGETIIGVYATHEDAALAEKRMNLEDWEYSSIEEYKVQGALSTNT